MDATKYLELKEQQRKELDAFPIAFAFNEEQLQEALQKLGAKDASECCTLYDMGDILLKKDVDAYHTMCQRHLQEVIALFKDKDLAEEIFLYEMNNHEYAINWEGDSDVLGALGLTKVGLSNLGLQDAYQCARRRHFNMMEERGII